MANWKHDVEREDGHGYGETQRECSNKLSVSFNATLKSIREEAAMVRSLMPGNVPSVYVMTYAVERKLREYFEDEHRSEEIYRQAVIKHPSDGFFGNTVCGVPFEAFPTMHECQERVLQLVREGQVVAMIG